MTPPLTAVLARGVEPLEDDHVRGNPSAAVTVLEYGDYECPYCAAAAPVLRRLVDESDGGVRLVFRNFPIADRHPYALTAALAAEGAAAQGAFWQMHELLFIKQDRLDDGSLRHYAELLGLDPELCVGDAAQQFGDKVEDDFAAGLAAGVEGTPSLFVDGRPFTGRVEMGALQRAVAAAGSAALANGAVEMGGVGGRDPRPRRQRWWPRRLGGAEREPFAHDPEQDDAEHRRDH